ncbi:MAG: hypothetical protein GKR87_10065 [Kiritimatiellae bacterium]|nr:hypothetical protein [Kiritimatiellia bacterium]
MDPSIQWFIIFIVAGIFLLGAEIFIPGGILGIFGAGALFAAIILGYTTFGGEIGTLVAVAIIFMAAIGLCIWIKFFPQTPIGKRLTLSKNARRFKATDDLHILRGKEGIAITTLRPSGIATIEGKRVDVVADGSWIEKKTPIRVIAVEGPIVTVRENTPSQTE